MANVNANSQHDKSTEQNLRSAGIGLKSYSLGQHYSTCPSCSDKRKPEHRKLQCLSVKIDEHGATWYCQNCLWKGSSNGHASEDGTYHYYSPTLRKLRKPKGSKPRFVWQHLDNGEWKSGAGGQATKSLLYNGELVEDWIEQGYVVFVVEGEKDADSLRELGFYAVSGAHGAGKWTIENTQALKGGDLIVIGDNDEAGRAHIKIVQEAVAKVAKSAVMVNILDLWPECPEGGDITDYIRSGRDPDLSAIFQSVKSVRSTGQNGNGHSGHSNNGNGHTTFSDEEIRQLVAMAPAELAKKIKEYAKSVGVPVPAMWAQYKHQRDHLGLKVDKLQGTTVKFEEPTPWDEPVDGAALLDEIANEAKRFVVLPEYAAEIVALWVAFTYIPKCYDVAPRLQIQAPDKRCGKTTLLDFLSEVVYRPVMCGNISVASFFRMVEMHHPTMLIDEIDSFAGESLDIRNVLNNGHHIKGSVIRCVGDDIEPRQFSCFAPVAYAHIGDLGKKFDTLIDRSIPAFLNRRAQDEKIEKLAVARRSNRFLELRRKLKRFTTDNLKIIQEADPSLPDIPDDRLEDNWRPLLAIASACGPIWEERAHRSVKERDDQASFGEMVLADMKEVFDRLGDDFIFSDVMCQQLIGFDDRPWAEWGAPPKHMTGKALATLIKDYGIKPKRDKAQSGRGYYREDLEPVWHRYVYSTPENSVRSVYRDENVDKKIDGSRVRNVSIDTSMCLTPEYLPEFPDDLDAKDE